MTLANSRTPPSLVFELEGPIATLTFNKPPQNRLTREVMVGLAEAVEAIAHSGARVVLLKAEGDDFSFGGDFTTWLDTPADVLKQRFERALALFNRFEHLPIPTVAAVQGRCLGGAFELVLRCDVVIASPSAVFGHPEQTLGVTTLLGGIHRVAARAGRAFAADMAFTSKLVTAETMLARGVVTQLADSDDDLRTQASAYVKRLSIGPTRAHAAHKALLHQWANGGVQAADEALMDVSMPLFGAEDTQRALESARAALDRGADRPTLIFENR